MHSVRYLHSKVRYDHIFIFSALDDYKKTSSGYVGHKTIFGHQYMTRDLSREVGGGTGVEISQSITLLSGQFRRGGGKDALFIQKTLKISIKNLPPPLLN